LMPLTQPQGVEGPAAAQQHRQHKRRKINSAAAGHRTAVRDVPLPLVLPPDSPTPPSAARAAVAAGIGQRLTSLGGVGGSGSAAAAAAALVLGGGSQAAPSVLMTAAEAAAACFRTSMRYRTVVGCF
jgi:hypothetical protein